MKRTSTTSALPVLALALLGGLWAGTAEAYKQTTHIWLAGEAVALLPAGDLKNELVFYLGPEDTLICDAATSETGTRLLDGVWEEDCDGHFVWHFWDPDTDTGLLNQRTAYEQALPRFNDALRLYFTGDKGAAYYELGRVAHLLQDMAQPAHVHRDAHPPTEFEDNFEALVEDIHFDYRHDLPTPSMSDDLKAFLGGFDLTPIDYSVLPTMYPDGLEYGSSDLRGLFLNMAEAADFFESEDEPGDTDDVYYDAGTASFGSSADFAFIAGHLAGTLPPAPPIPQFEFDASEARVHADVLLPLSLRYVAALYELFWARTHGLGGGELRISMLASPEPVRPGEVVSYSMTVTNEGAADLSGVELRQLLPDHIVNFNDDPVGGSCPGGICHAGEILTLPLGSLPAGQSRTVVLGLEVGSGSSAPADGTVLVSNAEVTELGGSAAVTSVAVTVESAPGLGLALVGDRSPVAPGGTLEYRLSYANSGPVSLTGTTLELALPDGAIFSSASNGGMASDGLVTWSLGTLSVDEAGQRTVTVVVDPALSGGEILLATAAVSSTAPAAGASAAESTAVVASPALGLSMAAGPSPVRPGGVVSYSTTVTNRGAVDLADLELRLQLPGYILGFNDDPVGGSCPGGICHAGEILLIPLGTLPAGQSRTIVLGMEVSSGSSQPPDNAFLRSSASVVDAAGAGATVGSAVIVHASPSLFLGLASEGGPVAPGEAVELVLPYGNSGPISLATGALSLTLPDGLSLLSASDGGTASGNQVHWDLGTLEVGEIGHRTATVVTGAAIPGGRILTLNAALAGGGTASAEASESLAVIASPRLGLAVTASPDPAHPGGVVGCTMIVTNRSGVDLPGVELRQQIPGYILSFNDDPVGGSCPGGTCHAGEILVIPLGTLPAGQSRTFNVGLELATGSSAAPDNTLLLSSVAVTESGGSGAAASSLVVADPTPGLSLGMSDDRDPAQPGTTVEFRLSYGNTGPVTLADGVLEATLPEGLAFQAASGGGTSSGNRVEWDLGTLSVSETGYRILTAVAGAGLVDGEILTTTTVVRDGGRTASAAARQATAVGAAPKLSLAMTAAPDPVAPGEVLSYSMTVTNNLPGDLAGVELRQQLPGPILSFNDDPLGGSCPGGTCHAGEVLTIPLGTLPGGQSEVVVVEMEVAAGSSAPPDNAVLWSTAEVDESFGAGASAAAAVMADASGLPPTCSQVDRIQISNVQIDQPTTYEACVSITAGPGVEVSSSLVLRSALVILQGGVSFEPGSEFRAGE